MEQLKLIALDSTDLNVVSAHLQDAVVKIGDMAYLPREKRFAALLNRFDWSSAVSEKETEPRRMQSALRFERVLRAQHSGLDLSAPETVLSLLALSFDAAAGDDPAGTVTLYFSGGGAVRLQVECVEAELKDLGPGWRVRSQPAHPEADSGAR